MLMLTVLTAGLERKHSACRAEIGGCVSGQTSGMDLLGNSAACFAPLVQMVQCRIQSACHKFTTVSGGILLISQM